MEQVLILCVRTIMRNEVRICILRLSRIFKRLCIKTIKTKVKTINERLARGYGPHIVHDRYKIEHIFRIFTIRRARISHFHYMMTKYYFRISTTRRARILCGRFKQSWMEGGSTKKGKGSKSHFYKDILY